MSCVCFFPHFLAHTFIIYNLDGAREWTFWEGSVVQVQKGVAVVRYWSTLVRATRSKTTPPVPLTGCQKTIESENVDIWFCLAVFERLLHWINYTFNVDLGIERHNKLIQKIIMQRLYFETFRVNTRSTIFTLSTSKLRSCI